MLTYWFVLCLGSFIIAYLIKIFRKQFYQLAEDSLSVVNSMILNMDEVEKVKLVQKYTAKLVVSLFKFIITIFISIVLGGIPIISIYFFKNFKEVSSIDFSSFESILTISVGATIGFIIPVWRKNKSTYSELSQLLHRLALNNYAIGYKLFKIDTKRIKKQNLHLNEKFVIVTGLARSGTTSLMNKLAEDEMFSSLNYANMPFITCPNLWRKIYNPKDTELKERSHKDGIMIGTNSNEALEEYFFKMLANNEYIKEKVMIQYELTEDNYTDYLKYQTIIKSNDKRLYLAKNNNFILRYDSLRKFNKEFLLIVMVREPLSHAFSLMQQHKNYLTQQQHDPFVLEYMNWLGHHEFGINQKEFQFFNSESQNITDKLSLDYWLVVWINYYNYILTIDRHNVILVKYHEYSMNPNKVLEEIEIKIGKKFNFNKIPSFIKNDKVDLKFNKEIKEKADSIYNKLLSI